MYGGVRRFFFAGPSTFRKQSTGEKQRQCLSRGFFYRVFGCFPTTKTPLKPKLKKLMSGKKTKQRQKIQFQLFSFLNHIVLACLKNIIKRYSIPILFLASGLPTHKVFFWFLVFGNNSFSGVF
jgi:hypothetical protein